MILNKKLLSLRKKSGMSQEELAAKLGVTRQSVSRWEIGTALPDAQNIQALSKIFFVSADFLLNDEEGEEKEILETRNASTPIVPVYEAEIPQEDMVMSDPVEQGDVVTHSKYGSGVVEKMIKYGTKTLYSINFDNVGRRLLDPTLTEIKKA